MAVAENAKAMIGSFNQNLDNNVVSSDLAASNDMEKSKPKLVPLSKVNDEFLQNLYSRVEKVDWYPIFKC